MSRRSQKQGHGNNKKRAATIGASLTNVADVTDTSPTSAPKTTPEDTKTGERSDELPRRVDELEVALLQQEHRTLRVFYNLWQYRKDEKLRSASVWALVSLLFSPGVVAAVGVSFVGIAGLWFAWDANEKIEAQNTLLRLAAADERQVVYRATIVNEDSNIKSVTFQPIASDAVLQEGRVFLPSVICDSQLPINQDGSLHGLGSFSINVREFIIDKYGALATDKDNWHVLELRIPALVLSSYVAKNQRYTDASLYDVEIVSILDERNLYPSLMIDGITFVGRLRESPKDPMAFIDGVFQQGQELHNKRMHRSSRSGEN